MRLRSKSVNMHRRASSGNVHEEECPLTASEKMYFEKMSEKLSNLGDVLSPKSAGRVGEMDTIIMAARGVRPTAPCRTQQSDMLRQFFGAVQDVGRHKLSYSIRTYLTMHVINNNELVQIMLETNWQEWILPLIKTDVPLSKNQEHEILTLSVHLFTAVHLYAFLTPPENIKRKSFADVLVQSINTIDDQCGWITSGPSISRLMLYSLLSAISKKSLNFKSDYESHIWDNAWALFRIVEDFTFYRPSRVQAAQRPAMSDVLMSLGAFRDEQAVADNSSRSKIVPGVQLDEQGFSNLTLAQQILDMLYNRMKIPDTMRCLETDARKKRYQRKQYSFGMIELDFWQNVVDFMVQFKQNATTQSINLSEEDFATILAKRTRKVSKSKWKAVLQAIDSIITVMISDCMALVPSSIANNVIHGLEHDVEQHRKPLINGEAMEVTIVTDENCTDPFNRRTNDYQDDIRINVLRKSSQPDSIFVDCCVSYSLIDSCTTITLQPNANAMLVKVVLPQNDPKADNEGKLSDDDTTEYMTQEAPVTASTLIRRFSFEDVANIDFQGKPELAVYENFLRLCFRRGTDIADDISDLGEIAADSPLAFEDDPGECSFDRSAN